VLLMSSRIKAFLRTTACIVDTILGPVSHCSRADLCSSVGGRPPGHTSHARHCVGICNSQSRCNHIRIPSLAYRVDCTCHLGQPGVSVVWRQSSFRPCRSLLSCFLPDFSDAGATQYPRDTQPAIHAAHRRVMTLSADAFLPLMAGYLCLLSKATSRLLFQQGSLGCSR